MSIKVLLEVNAKSENIEEVKALLKQTLGDTRSYDGCEGLDVILNQDDASNLILLETWKTRQHYEKYLAWRQETGALEALGAMLAQPPSIRFYDNSDI